MSIHIKFVCPECKSKVEGLLSHWEYSDAKKQDTPICLHILSCESCGVYGVYIECPKCEKEIDVYS